MALIERIMRLKDDGTPMGENYTMHIPVRKFESACGEIIHGRQTVAQVKTGLGLRTAIAPGDVVSDTQEMDALIALAPTGTNALATAQKAMYLISVTHALGLAQFARRISWEYPGYITPAQIRAKLGI